MVQRELLHEARHRSFPECKTVYDIRKCKKCNNFISKAIRVILSYERHACIMRICAKGLNGHVENMAFHKRQMILINQITT
jgi:hypothetical protein